MELTPEILTAIQNAVCASVEATVKKTVNGKIDDMRRDLIAHNTQHEGDMQDIKPFIKAAAGARFAFRLYLVTGSAVAAYLALKQFVGAHFTFTP